MLEASDTRLSRIDVGQGDHRRRERGGIEEQRILIHEVPESRLVTGTPDVCLGRKMFPRYLQLFTEVAELFRLSFKVVVLLVGKHEIQEDETGLNELD